MYSFCKNHLIEKLEAAGMQSPVKTSMTQLAACRDSHVSAVLPKSDSFLKTKEVTHFKDVNGCNMQRTKRMQRDLVFSVVIGDYEDDTCEHIFLSFISKLDDGITLDGNYIPIEIVEGSVDWVDEADSILLSKMAVKFDVKFSGGIYVDKVLSTPNGFKLNVEMEAIY